MELNVFLNEVTRQFPRQWGLRSMTRDELLAAWWVFSQLTIENIRLAIESLTSSCPGA